MTSISENNQKKTYVIGITGSIGCGKSLVGRQLQELGVAVIDADHLSHELVNNPGPAYDKILARFGADLAISPGGPIDRKKLGAIVFADSAARTDLEAILHPAIGELQKTRTIELAKTHDIVAVLVPLLFETGSRAKYSAVWAVVVHKEIQIQRLKLRDKLSDEEVVRRIKAQWPQDKKAELADHVIDNSGSPDQTMERVKFLVGEIRTKMGLPQGQTPTPDRAPAPTGRQRGQSRRGPVALSGDDPVREHGDVHAGEHRRRHRGRGRTPADPQPPVGAPPCRDVRRGRVRRAARFRGGETRRPRGCNCRW